jgi:AcrR family transcriptional regulator
MTVQDSHVAGTRQDRRKAATRAKILSAAESLFSAQGYSATSIEEISTAADVAVRTIYIHFPSKAAIMLAYFDDWMDAFVAEILRRPGDEPVVETVREALRVMTEAGWADRVETAEGGVHPLVEQLGPTGSPDIAGYVLQRWVTEMDRIADDAARRGGFADGSLGAQARAVVIFAAWIGALWTAGGSARAAEQGRALPPHATGNSLGLGILGLITGGDL